jgi:hypothetical protein
LKKQLLKFLPHILIVAAVLWGIVFTARSCRIEDKYSKLKGAYEEARRVAEADHAAQMKIIEEAHLVIAEKDRAIAASDKTINTYKKVLTLKDAHLIELEGDLGAARTDAERVPILTAMVETWREKYGVLEGVVAEKDKQLAGWGGKYAAAVTIGDTWKAQYEAEHRLRLSGETLNKSLEGKYRRARIISSAKTVALVAIAGLLTYKFIGGK